MLTYVEYAGVLFGLVYVVLAARNLVWCWPAGIASSVIYVYLNFHWQLYFDASLQFFYIVAGFYGWALWYKNSNIQASSITTQNLFEQLKWFAAGLLSSILLGFIAFSYLHQHITYFDATVTVFSLIATYFTAKKYLHSWVWWIVIDITASAMYIYKQANATAFLYLMYGIVAVYGFLSWKKLIQLGTTNE